MTVNSGYKRWLGCVLEKKGFRIICLFVLSVCFILHTGEDVEEGGWAEMEGSVLVLSFLSLV